MTVKDLLVQIGVLYVEGKLKDQRNEELVAALRAAQAPTQAPTEESPEQE